MTLKIHAKSKIENIGFNLKHIVWIVSLFYISFISAFFVNCSFDKY